MKKRFVFLLGAMIVVLCIGMTACGDSEEAVTEETTEAPTEATTETTTAPAVADENGYVGDDPVIAEVYDYLADEIADQYGVDDDDSIISVPVVEVIDESAGDNGETVVKGAFWVYNYKIEGDTLKCVSGGAHPGAMHVVKDDDGDEYEVIKFDAVGDGSQFEPTAKEIFGDKYEDFMKYDSDDKAQEALRGEILAAYVKSHNLSVTKYQDEGWDPIDLPL